VLGLGMLALWKENKATRKEALHDRVKHREELQALNNSVREKELEYLATLRDVTTLMEQVTDGQEKTLNEFTGLKDLVLSKIDDLKNKLIDGKGNNEV
jgi:hypothetical protein